MSYTDTSPHISLESPLIRELSTDVYDELVRRQTNSTDNEVPFLPVRDDFHPKRNQARQKLATLPTGRFKDLSSDVYYELARRYPEFKETAPDLTTLVSPGTSYEETSPLPRSARQSQDPDYGNVSGSLSRKQSEDFSIGRRSEIDAYGGMDPFSSPAPPLPTSLPSGGPAANVRRRPSQAEDRRRPSQDTTGRRRPSESQSVVSDSNSASTQNAQSATAGMVIPNKSTIAEEEIEVPYGREVRESSGTATDERGRRLGDGGGGGGPFRDPSGERSRGTDTEGDDDMRSPVGGLAGLSGLSARLQANNPGEDEEEGGRSSGAGARSGEDYFSYGRGG
ncbi:component of the polarisome [Steccherinum ochraceum]|uniref:Component of the polarisome n=1 Tax=Steccherinum ochraceum TaxID=92696 RepID=A0A4V6N700_9APHY|nr:component of the polarisome [Steccherinum ochraceum]